jgi:hypothetical protein
MVPEIYDSQDAHGLERKACTTQLIRVYDTSTAIKSKIIAAICIAIFQLHINMRYVTEGDGKINQFTSAKFDL